MPSLSHPVVVAALVVALAACGFNDNDTGSAPAGRPTIRQDVEAEDWLLDADRSSIDVPEGTPVTLAVQGDAVAGLAPCNAYRGEISVGEDGTVDVSHLALTRRACEPATMQAEDDFVAALEAVDHVTVDDDRLVLRKGDEVRLAFRAYDAAELLSEGTWDIVSVATGDSIDSMLAGTQPTLTFEPDGDLTLVTGCNDAHGTWELDGDRLDIGPLRQTLKACAEPEGVMDQEHTLTSALESAARVDIAPGELTILDAAGRIALDATQG